NKFNKLYIILLNMPIYKYKAFNKDKKAQEGMIEANSKDDAGEILAENGLFAVSILEVSFRRSKINLDFLNRVKTKHIVIFSRQFSVLISANVSMVQALKILIDQTDNMTLKMVISKVADEVDAGSTLSESLCKRSDIFSNFYVSVVRSGETSGKLDEVLSYLADEMEKDYDMMSKIKGAMIYPVFVLCSLIAVGVIMMIFVIPKFTAMFAESGVALPITTRILIHASGFMQKYWWLLIIIAVGVVAVFKWYTKRPYGKRQFDYIKLKLPIFGHLFQLIYLVRFTRSMNTLIVSGITIDNSLKVAADVVDNKIYQELIETTIKEVEDGNSISGVFINSKIIPKMVSQMLNIGEKTGKMDIILERITNFYGREISNIVANLMTLIEPLIMIILGVAVGIMVAAVILPMYNLAGSL
ncbi:type II secretion system F family protein, partial [Patescibacteria group bacterium]|nr:type II secretion system F family protein [Patescibacteria group bacterium]